jgi:large subunit ribosomal protein L1
MAKKSKKMQDALKKVDATKAYSVEEAVALAKDTNIAKFDATVEVAYRLNVDPKKADQQIRGAVVLPNGTGKTQKVGKLGRVLGPKGLMPNPKTGTVTMDVTKAINEVKAGKVTYRVDRNGNIHVPIGKVSFDNEKLVENFKTIHDVLVKAKPSAAKGTYMKNITVTTTFGPGVHVDSASF